MSCIVVSDDVLVRVERFLLCAGALGHRAGIDVDQRLVRLSVVIAQVGFEVCEFDLAIQQRLLMGLPAGNQG